MKALFRSRLLPETVILLVVAVASYACKDFLNRTAQGALDAETLANKAGVEGSLIATYRCLDHNTGVGGAWGNAASNWVWGSVAGDDAHTGSEPSDQPGVTDIEMYNWSTAAADGYLNDKWRQVYEGVVRANATIRLLDTVVARNPNEITQADQDGIRGEALFLRAHYHFEAWQMWGNIPYYTETDTDYRKSNVGVDAPALILADLDAAIALLPETPRNGEVGRVTSWTAEAYKGRVQVYSGDYAGGVTTLRNVRDAGPYDLEDNYVQVWTGFEEYSNGPETILAYQASANDGEPGGENANWGERLNFPHSGSPFGCCGFHQPTFTFVNFFQVDANGLPLAWTNPNWDASDAEKDAAATANMRLDPRLDWSVGRDDVPYKDWGVHAAGWIRNPTWGGPYSPKKTAYESASGAMSNVGWTNTQLSSMNIHIFRYADALLLLAEADVETNQLQEACEIVNEIRDRAGEVAQGPGTSTANMAVPIDDPSITWADYQIGLYSCPFASQAYGRTAVEYERILELGMEGHRFFDLRRWGTAQAVINAFKPVEARRIAMLTTAGAYEGRHNLFPLPIVQVELSKVGGTPALVQNPGW